MDEERLKSIEEWIANRGSQQLGYPIDPTTQQILNRWLFPLTRFLVIRLEASSTSLAAGTTISGDFEIPFSGAIVDVGAYVDTAGTTNATTIDVNKNGTTIMGTTKITIDSGEKSSRTAATAPVISVPFVEKGDLITADIDGVSTTPPKGLTVRLTLQVQEK